VVIDLTLRRPRPIQKKNTSSKKRKRNDGENETITKVTKKVGTLSEHFLEFIEGVMDTLDDHNMKVKAICDLLCNEKHAVTYR
jgi:hypothetical protein